MTSMTASSFSFTSAVASAPRSSTGRPVVAHLPIARLPIARLPIARLPVAPSSPDSTLAAGTVFGVVVRGVLALVPFAGLAWVFVTI